jgi:hypothetical protein
MSPWETYWQNPDLLREGYAPTLKFTLSFQTTVKVPRESVVVARVEASFGL